MNRGSGEKGKLGFGDNDQKKEPDLFDTFTETFNYGWKLVEIACGVNHSMAILEMKSEREENNG